MAEGHDTGTPTFTVLTPVYRPEPEHLREAVGSVLGQTCPDWELVLVLDGPQPPEVEDVLASVDDPRVSVVRRDENGGIVAASADGLAVARGSFVALLDHDDVLAPFALEACTEAILRWPDVDVVYSDEDKLDYDGRRDEPFCKPGWSPERLRSHMYLGHLGVYRRGLVEEVGGFREGYDGAQDHDLALRATERARRVVHIPRILYHWRRSAQSTAAVPDAKDWAYAAGARAVQSHLDRIGMPAKAVQDEGHTGVVLIEPELREHPMVSIVVPTGGHSRIVAGERVDLVDRALRSVIDRSSYPNFEVVVVIDRTAPVGLAKRLAAIDPRIRPVHNQRPFNFSEACNLGRDRALGEIAVFLNDDTEVVQADWLERLVLFANLDGVGVVGVKLEYSDGRVQHCGLVGRGGGVGHRFWGCAAGLAGEFQALRVQSNLLAVTGACIAVRMDRFDAVGGFSAAFPLAFNDVDLCLKLLAAGYRTVFDPMTRLLHHESSTRDPAVRAAEVEAMNRRWRDLLHDDPYDNPALRTHGYEQLQPPAVLLQMRERLGDDLHEPRSWPLVRTADRTNASR